MVAAGPALTLCRSSRGVMTSSITFFSIPKAFVGHTGVIQTNAIRSWSRIPGAEVILFGDEPGVAETSAALGVRHEATVERNALGTPLISDAFARASRVATREVLAYVNADIMFTSDIVAGVTAVRRSAGRSWLMVGRRHDIDIVDDVDVITEGEDAFRRRVLARATLHGPSGIDYVVFPRDLAIPWPPMAVGRPGWDSWLMYSMRAAGVALIDASAAILAIHQNHPPAYSSTGVEARHNRLAGGGFYRMGTMRDANWRLVADGTNGLQLRRQRMGDILFAPPVRALIALKRLLLWYRDTRGGVSR